MNPSKKKLQTGTRQNIRRKKTPRRTRASLCAEPTHKHAHTHTNHVANELLYSLGTHKSIYAPEHTMHRNVQSNIFAYACVLYRHMHTYISANILITLELLMKTTIERQQPPITSPSVWLGCGKEMEKKTCKPVQRTQNHTHTPIESIASDRENHHVDISQQKHTNENPIRCDTPIQAFAGRPAAIDGRLACWPKRRQAVHEQKLLIENNMCSRSGRTCSPRLCTRMHDWRASFAPNTLSKL